MNTRPHTGAAFRTVILMCMLCLAYSAFGQQFQRTGNTVTYRGNTFEYATPGTDEVTITDPVTRKQVKKRVTRDAVPVKMNGTRIYAASEVTTKPVQVDESVSLQLYVLKGLTTEFSKLPNGRYLLYLSNIIVDSKGRLVYYEYEGVSAERSKYKIPADIRKAIDNKIDILVNKIAFRPGMLNDKPVTVLTDITMGMFTIVVKNHKAVVTRD